MMMMPVVGVDMHIFLSVWAGGAAIHGSIHG